MAPPHSRLSRYATQHPPTSSSTLTNTNTNDTTDALDSAVSLSSASAPPPPPHSKSSKSSAIKHFCLPLPNLHSDSHSQSSARAPAKLRKKERHGNARFSTSTNASTKTHRQSWLWRRNVESAQEYQHQDHDEDDATTVHEAQDLRQEEALRTSRRRARRSSVTANDAGLEAGSLVWRAYPEPLEVYEFDTEAEVAAWEEDLTGARGNGDCVVRFEADTENLSNHMNHGKQRSAPKFELIVNSAKIQGANIAFLNDLLRAGRRTALVVAQSGDESSSQKYPNELESGTRATNGGGTTYLPFPRADHLTVPHRELKRHSLLQLPLLRQYSPLKFPQFDVRSRPGSWNPGSGSVGNGGAAAGVTRNGYTSSSEVDQQEDLDKAIADTTKFELVLAAPAQSDVQSTRAYRLAVRNLFAVLERQPIVGRELVPALVDVQDLVDAFDVIPFQGSPHKHRSAAVAVQPNPRLVTEYVRAMRLDDVRYDLEQAVAMLAWSEMPAIRWAEGYKELFVHVVGMLSAEQGAYEGRGTPGVVLGRGSASGLHQLSDVTRTNVLAACDALKLVVQDTEERLTDFSCPEMWTAREAERIGDETVSTQDWQSRKQTAAAHQAGEEFRLFVFTHYRKAFGSWPPMPDFKKDNWIDRTLVEGLQADFGMLYEYLVDKDVSWEKMHAAYCREYEMVSKRDADVKPDTHVPITDVLVKYDSDNDLQHIPHPYPLLPVDDKPVKRRSIFGSLSRSKSASSSTRMDIFSQASNTDLDREGSDFLTAFKQHEANFSIPSVTAQEARLGRWIQLYGILQTLSHLSADVRGLRYTEDVDYFLCFGLNGIAPWNSTSVGRSAVVMPAQEASYCWKVAESWKVPRAVSAESPIRKPAVEMSLVPPPLQLRPSGSGDSGIATPIDPVVEPNHFVMPDGSLVPVPSSYLRPSPVHATFARSTSQSSISALPQIPEKSEKRRKSMSFTLSNASNGDGGPSIDSHNKHQAQSESRARMSITPSLKSETSKKRDTILSMEGTEWADTEFSGDGVEGSEAMAVDLKRGGRGRFVAVERGMASRSTVAEE